MNYRGKRVLVTGACGFIGSHLVEELVRLGADVTALVYYNSRNDWGCLEEVNSSVINSCNVEIGDIRDAYFTRRLTKDKDVVFHLAALIGIPYSYIAPMSYLRTNVEGTLNLLEGAREYGVERFVHTSTSEVYGTALYTPIDENHPLQGQSPYSASKISADKIAESYYRSFDVPVVTIRPFNTYGPRQSARAIIPTVASQLLTGRDELKLGSLEPVRDMNYVADTVKGFILAGVSSNECLGEVMNLGSGRGVSIGDIVKMLMKVTERDVPIVLDRQRVRPNNSEVFTLIAAVDKAKKLLSWEPEYSLENGLRNVRDYVASNTSRYKANIYNV